jgi:hypothetical protein
MDLNHNRAIEELVPRPRAAAECGVSTRTAARWEAAKLPGFDDPITINRRVYHRRSRLEVAKAGRKCDAEAM